METSSKSVMMMFHIPEDRELLAALGIITLRHSHLDHILRMTVKTLSEVSIEQAKDATAFEGSGVLRHRIRKLAKRRLGEGAALIQLQALLECCRRATEKRNILIHNIWAQELDGEPKVQTQNHKWEPLPTIDELNALSTELSSLASELNNARLDGFLSQALAVTKKSSGAYG